MTATLFDLMADQQEPEAPRCRMCARPARWVKTSGEYGMYCAGRSCSNRNRLCQSCGAEFTMNVDGAGTKYCSRDCKADGYRPHVVKARHTTCAWCGAVREASSRRAASGWPFVCETCLAPIRPVLQRLRAHHVPHERVRRLLGDPGCEVCGIDIVTPTTNHRTRTMSPLLVVDHDHQCCPAGHYSCGQCVRGLLCANCNTAAGMLRDDAALARAIANYLAKGERR